MVSGRRRIDRRAALAFIASISLALISAPICAQTTSDRAEQARWDARDQISILSDWGSRIAADPSLTIEAAQESFRELLPDLFDTRMIAQLVFGRAWRRAAPQDRDAMIVIVEREMVEGFGGNLARFRDRRMIVVSTSSIGPGTVRVDTSVISPTAPPIDVVWRLERHADGSMRIVDVSLLGFSLVVNQRLILAGMLAARRGDLRQLLEDLGAPVNPTGGS